MPPTTLRAVLFDWDGTLADTAEPSYRCYVRMFADFGIAFDRDAYRRTYSPDWYHTFASVGLPRERWHDADERWLAYFADEVPLLLDGVHETLEALAARGVMSAIVTSGSRPRIVRELAHHGVEHHFREVVCGADTERRKPHPDPLQLGLTRMGLAPQDAVYVGDSPEDILMAKAAGVFAVGVPGPYPNREALVSSAPDALAEDLAGVVAALF
jgi:HAD superfamily hydrolase (TIGR01509 family)